MIVEKIFKNKLDEYFAHQKEENVFYVTDLVKCPLTLKYENEYKDLAITNSLNSSAIMGTFIHSGLEDFLKSNFSNIQTEVPVEKEIVVQGKNIKIKGRVDAIIGTNGEKVVVEIKSGRSDKGIPHEHHIIQLRIYLWLTGIRKGLLLYITSDRIAEYSVNEPLDEAEIIRLVEETLKMSKAPRYQWECKYCVYAKVCSMVQQQNQNGNK